MYTYKYEYYILYKYLYIKYSGLTGKNPFNTEYFVFWLEQIALFAENRPPRGIPGFRSRLEEYFWIFCFSHVAVDCPLTWNRRCPIGQWIKCRALGRGEDRRRMCRTRHQVAAVTVSSETGQDHPGCRVRERIEMRRQLVHHLLQSSGRDTKRNRTN